MSGLADDLWSRWEERVETADQVFEKIHSISNRFNERPRRFVWRGQADASWAIHSSLYRRLDGSRVQGGKQIDEDALFEAEKQILLEARLRALNRISAGPLSALEMLAMLQHFGAPTRLIDVSYNALVGLFFAVEEKLKNGCNGNKAIDGRLFAIDVTQISLNSGDLRFRIVQVTGPGHPDAKQVHTVYYEELDYLAWANFRKPIWCKTVLEWKPSRLDARMAAQNAGFLLGGMPQDENGKKVASVTVRPTELTQPSLDGTLYTIRIPFQAKKDIRERLDRMYGINHASMYPDYQGFADYGIEPILQKLRAPPQETAT